MRSLLGAALLVLAALSAGCADECETACGKLDFCQALLTMDAFDCVDTCKGADSKVVSPCSDCLDNTGCNGINSGSCGTACEHFER